MNPDPDIEYAVAAFGDRRGNAFLDALDGSCPVATLPDSAAGLPGAGLELARLIRSRGVNLVHAHDVKTDFLSALVGPRAGVPIVTTVHGYIAVDWKSRLRRRADAWLLKRMDRVVAVSQAMKRTFLAQGIDGRRIRLLRNCIRLDRYPFGYRSEALRRLPGVDDGDVLVGHVGRLSPEKGQRRLLRVFPEILRVVPRARLVFAGDGPDSEILHGRAEASGVGPRVHFLGYREDIREVFGGLDLLVLSSDTEGLPNVVLEAMALGVPVVATAVGGTPEVAEDRVTALLVGASDEGALVRAITEALVDRAGAIDRAKRAREVVEREFDMGGLVKATHEMYREIAAEGA